MEPETNKSKALSKEETKGLLSLIEKSKIINNKKTTTTSNKLKVEEWIRISAIFNATVGTCRRTPQQLRLKWENLKKNSRKRITLMKMERIKTGGGPLGYFPHDEILDRVASLLGSTGEGPTIIGGDAEPQLVGSCGGVSGDEGDELVPVLKDCSSTRLSENPTSVLTDHVLSVSSDNIISTTPISNIMPTNDIGDDELMLAKTTRTPVAPNNKIRFRSIGVKRKMLKSDYVRQARNIAIAKYYNVKRKLLESKLDNIKLENEKLRLEVRKLKGKDV